MKLHLGCGSKIFPGWVNIDIEAKEADSIEDAKELKSIKNNSCTLIYASHLLEHFSRHDVGDVIKLWYSKLKPKGILRLSVPDFEKTVRMYQNGYELDQLLGFIVGGHRDRYDWHGMIFDRKNLTKLLKNAGFKKIIDWDWRNTGHSHVDDYSQAYLPHMEKENGVMMSLNLEAVK